MQASARAEEPREEQQQLNQNKRRHEERGRDKTEQTECKRATERGGEWKMELSLQQGAAHDLETRRHAAPHAARP
eukprot:5549029-Pleurochrysis_carterae.AAC.2